MQKYINQLIGDIRGAHGKTGQHKTEFNLENDLPEYFNQMTLDEYPFKDFCGLNQIQFPPEEMLSSDQKTAVCNEFEVMMYSYNLELVLPENLPKTAQYPLLSEMLDKKVPLVEESLHCVELCQIDPNKCSFGIYCECKGILEEESPEDQVKDLL